MRSVQELNDLAQMLRRAASPDELKESEAEISNIEKVVEEVARSFCGSWLGYHSRVYYKGLLPVPPGAHFSQEWGLKELFSDMGSRGDWVEFDRQEIKSIILIEAGSPNLSRLAAAERKSRELLVGAVAEIQSILSAEDDGSDTYISKLKAEVGEVTVLSGVDVLNIWKPKGQLMSRDMIAIGQGFQSPPHLEIKAEYIALRHTFGQCKKASELCLKVASHFERKSRRTTRDERVGTNVFIGHGRSLAWREVKDFVSDRLRLPWDEFNRVPVAGVTNIARLSEMLDAAAIALVIMTAEDETADGEVRARMNVVHEVGLFQGRLGFTKAIVLFEEGCAEFTNIQGLGQIRFPKGKISAVFEEVRSVLEREGLLGQ